MTRCIQLETVRNTGKSFTASTAKSEGIRRCPILVELEEAGCLAELKRQRKELGKHITLSTDRNAKSYKEATESNIIHDIEEIKRANEKIQKSLEKNQDNKGLLKGFQRLLEKNNKKIASKTHNQICENLKKFRSEFNHEVDHKLQHLKYDVIKILQDQGIIQNVNNTQPASLTLTPSSTKYSKMKIIGTTKNTMRMRKKRSEWTTKTKDSTINKT